MLSYLIHNWYIIVHYIDRKRISFGKYLKVALISLLIFLDHVIWAFLCFKICEEIVVSAGKENEDHSLRFFIPPKSMKTRTTGLVGINEEWREAIWILGKGGVMLSARRLLSRNESSWRPQMPKGAVPSWLSYVWYLPI